ATAANATNTTPGTPIFVLRTVSVTLLDIRPIPSALGEYGGSHPGEHMINDHPHLPGLTLKPIRDPLPRRFRPVLPHRAGQPRRRHQPGQHHIHRPDRIPPRELT